MLLVQGLVFAVIYYFLFRFIIIKFNLKHQVGKKIMMKMKTEEVSDRENKFAAMAAAIYDGLGGDANVTSIDNCITRLRVEVKDMDNVDQKKIKAYRCSRN